MKLKQVTTPRMKLNGFLDALQNRPPCPAGCNKGMIAVVEDRPYGAMRTWQVCPTCQGQGRVGELKFGHDITAKDVKG